MEFLKDILAAMLGLFAALVVKELFQFIKPFVQHLKLKLKWPGGRLIRVLAVSVTMNDVNTEFIRRNPGYSTFTLWLPGLGEVVMLTKKPIAVLAITEVFAAHDWTIKMRGLRARFHSPCLEDKGDIRE